MALVAMFSIVTPKDILGVISKSILPGVFMSLSKKCVCVCVRACVCVFRVLL